MNQVKKMKRFFICSIIYSLFFCLVSESLNAEEPFSSTTGDNYFDVRGGLENCRIKFTQEKKGRVVYLGGSITTMQGWRELTYDLLKKRFPETEFDFIDAGIGGTNSTLGAFRFEDDVFKKGAVDLLFLEFAVNDGGGDAPDNRRVRAMEGIIRQARKLNPQIDILMQYFVTQDYVKEITEGKIPASIVEHEKVAQYYQIPIINLAQEMTRRINAKEFVWEQFSRDSCHPKSFGHQLYVICIDKFLDAAWAAPIEPDAKLTTYATPAPLDSMNYENGRFLDPQQAKCKKGWKFVKDWKADKTCNYGGPVDVVTAEHPGDELQLTFEGSLIGFYGIAGFDAGILEYSVDGGEKNTIDLFDYYCTQFHRPVSRILAENLQPGSHTITIVMKNEKNEKSVGNACRILKWMAN